MTCSLIPFAGCGFNLTGDPHFEERERLTSPDGKIEAIIEFVSGGATVSSAITVYLVPKGKKLGNYMDRERYRFLALTRPIARAAIGIDAAWTDDNILSISYESKRDSFWNKAKFAFEGSEYSMVDEKEQKEGFAKSRPQTKI